MLDHWAQREAGVADYKSLDEERKAALQGRLEARIRKNTYDLQSEVIILDADRAAGVSDLRYRCIGTEIQAASSP